ncbi:MAG: ABC transporter permease subunit [Chloroflexi bacterium]|nr:ABC transporter permease subunit [Chloroflexota bacterium]
MATVRPGEALHTGGLGALGEITSSAFTPDLSWDTIRLAAIAAFRTLMYAVAGMSIALLIGVPLGIAASGVLFRNPLARFGVVVAIRGFLAVLRSVHEIVWAVLFVFALGLSPVAGVLAIGIPYGGILGRIIAERITDAPERPLDALRATGASPFQVLMYGQLPIATPDLVSYLFYRLECAVRAAAVLSFVGLGGLGFRITIALDDLNYDEAWTSIYALVILVAGIDLWSAQVRRRLL